MKKIKSISFILSIIMLLISFQGFSQEMSKQDYQDKSRRQKTTALVMLGGGAAIGTVGIIIADNNLVTCMGCTPAEENAGKIGAAMFGIGILSALGSIPVFISSGKNAKRAAQLGFSNEPIHVPYYAGNLPRSVPSISLKIPL